MLTKRDRTWSTSIRTPTRNRNSIHECRDPNTTLQHKTRHADERAHGSSTFEAACSHENRTWRECQGSVTKPWITLDRSDSTLTIEQLYKCNIILEAIWYRSIIIFLPYKAILGLHNVKVNKSVSSVSCENDWQSVLQILYSGSCHLPSLKCLWTITAEILILIFSINKDTWEIHCCSTTVWESLYIHPHTQNLTHAETAIIIWVMD